MKILVTGAAGQLARSLAERMVAREDFQFSAIGRPELDLDRSGSAERAIARIAPDVVINCAAFTQVDAAEDEPDRAFRINARGAGEVASAAARVGARLIQVSTDYVFDGRATTPYVESAAANPINVYGRSKLAGEEQVRAANADHVIVRTAWLFSPFGRNFVKTIAAAANTGRVLTVVDDQWGSPTSALDLADGLIAILDRWADEPATGLGEIFHLAGRPPISWCGFARATMDECRAQGMAVSEVEPISGKDWPSKATRPAMSALDSTKFATAFGYSTPALDASLADVLRRLAADQ